MTKPAGEPIGAVSVGQVPHAVMEQLFAARTVLVFGEICSALSERVCMQLLALAAAGSAPIRMLVHSQGGHVEAADSIHDVIRSIQPEVTMIGTGWVASAGVMVFVAAPRHCRFALPNTRFLLHEPSTSMGGSVSDIEIEVSQVVAMRARLVRILARETGQTAERITADIERNLWLDVTAATDYGLVSGVLERW